MSMNIYLQPPEKYDLITWYTYTLKIISGWPYLILKILANCIYLKNDDLSPTTKILWLSTWVNLRHDMWLFFANLSTWVPCFIKLQVRHAMIFTVRRSQINSSSLIHAIFSCLHPQNVIIRNERGIWVSYVIRGIWSYSSRQSFIRLLIWWPALLMLFFMAQNPNRLKTEWNHAIWSLI